MCELAVRRRGAFQIILVLVRESMVPSLLIADHAVSYINVKLQLRVVCIIYCFVVFHSSSA